MIFELIPGGSTDSWTRSSRAQTTLDFAIGAGVFLVAIAFVVAFVPGMFVPFDADTGTITADRVADSAAKDLLGDPAEPGALDTACTVGFFAQMNGGQAPDDCRFDPDAEEPGEVFGVSDRINLTIEERDGPIVETETKAGDPIQLAAGDDPATAQSVSTVRRTVLFDGGSKRLVVRVW
ncbi:putative pilin/flagellin [Halalkaliarchaeum sp. AArc-CO]|uniref:DUF7287 family protein n=1 Tax=unclassified Halalkaliarchaeum TaxID=2678344 RepID=UPI00217D9C11|nr:MULTISPECIES: hypothetical protein [unclassified Halalkaliarchaeum]MDR5671895.1 hypothetical protein [Halalkaliarchaeum sp. AArc-GB]UWG51400.1 putative pilin/flagellin [Halalkaliarchaeum sp. AArc-CO]